MRTRCAISPGRREPQAFSSHVSRLNMIFHRILQVIKWTLYPARLSHFTVEYRHSFIIPPATWNGMATMMDVLNLFSSWWGRRRPANRYKSLKPSTLSILGPIMRVFNLIWLASSLYFTSVQANPAANVQRRGCRTASDPSCDFLLQRCVANVCILNLPFPA